jgi:hypothetical protein
MDQSMYLAQEVGHLFKSSRRGLFNTRAHGDHVVLAPKSGKWTTAEAEKVAAIVAPIAVVNKQHWRIYPHPAGHVFG